MNNFTFGDKVYNVRPGEHDVDITAGTITGVAFKLDGTPRYFLNGNTWSWLNEGQIVTSFEEAIEEARKYVSAEFSFDDVAKNMDDVNLKAAEAASNMLRSVA